MPRDKYSRSPSRSKKSKRSRSRDRDRDRDYDRDYRDRKHKKSSKSSRSRDYSPEYRKKRDRSRDRSRNRHRRHSSSSSEKSTGSSNPSSRASSRYKAPTRPDRSDSRSKSSGPPSNCPPPPIISFQDERYNFQDAVSVLDATGSGNKESVAEIEKNEFVPQSFSSSSSVKKLPDKVKIDLDMETIELPPMPNQEEEVDTLFNPKFFGDEKERMQRWIKKLLSYRQPRMETN
uniref:CSON014410 protein n=1 Tax=Culicoides sonorensis TaxID=179676 RepID=A0A336JX60_CULSO